MIRFNLYVLYFLKTVLDFQLTTVRLELSHVLCIANSMRFPAIKESEDRVTLGKVTITTRIKVARFMTHRVDILRQPLDVQDVAAAHFLTTFCARNVTAYDVSINHLWGQFSFTKLGLEGREAIALEKSPNGLCWRRYVDR